MKVHSWTDSAERWGARVRRAQPSEESCRRMVSIPLVLPSAIPRRHLTGTRVVVPLAVEAPFGTHRRPGAEICTVGGAVRVPTHTHNSGAGTLCSARPGIQVGGLTHIHVRLEGTQRRSCPASSQTLSSRLVSTSSTLTLLRSAKSTCPANILASPCSAIRTPPREAVQ